MVILAAIERLLDVAAKRWGINIVQEIETADEIVVLPQGASGFIFAGIGTELAHDNTLSRRFQGQGHEDPLHVIPFFDNEGGGQFADGLEQHAVVVLTRLLEAIQRGADGIVDIPVARGELIAEHIEESEIDRVGAVGIGGMYFGLYVRRIVEQKIEHIVTLMVMGANDVGIDGDMVRHQGVGDDALFQPEVFG